MTFLSLDKLVILYSRNVSFLRRLKHAGRPNDTALGRLTYVIAQVSVGEWKYINEAAERSRGDPALDAGRPFAGRSTLPAGAKGAANTTQS
jgi:hypothetical protein